MPVPSVQSPVVGRDPRRGGTRHKGKAGSCGRLSPGLCYEQPRRHPYKLQQTLDSQLLRCLHYKRATIHKEYEQQQASKHTKRTTQQLKTLVLRTNNFKRLYKFRGASCLLRMNIQRKPGDWNCKSCQHLNFSRRDYCQHCRIPRPDLQFSDGHGTGGVLTSLDIRPGDWYCTCGYHNFASRSSCFKCGTIVRDFPAGQGAAGAEGDFARSRESAGVRAGWKAGDWICTRPGCNVHNFASRTECYRCNAPREAVGTGM